MRWRGEIQYASRVDSPLVRENPLQGVLQGPSAGANWYGRRGENVDQKTTELIEALRLRMKTEKILKLTTEKIVEIAGFSA
jgi:hypothetical protein